MIRIILKTVLVLVIIIGWYSFIVYADMRVDVIGNQSNYSAAIIDKIQLLKNSPPGKIVLLGGSNLAFGVDSNKIHASTKRPVVNMGLHAGIGLNFLFKLSAQYIYKNDIVICSPEYAFWGGSQFYGDSTLIDTLYYVPELCSLIFEWPQLFSILERNIYRNHNLWKRIYDNKGFVKDIYYREGFNTCGDVVSHLGKPNRGFKLRTSPVLNDDLFLHKVADFKKLVEKKGAKLVFVYPCIPRSQYERDKSVINSIHRSVVAAKILPRLTPEDFVFDDSCFFDTTYHLNSACTDKRSQLLVQAINQSDIFSGND